MILTLTHHAEPTAWARARQSGARYFTSPKVTRAKRWLAFLAREQMGKKAIITGPVALRCWFSFAARKHDPGPHTQKPDVDNLIKLVADALTGIVWVDDVQVVEVHATKNWSVMGGETEIEVETL